MTLQPTGTERSHSAGARRYAPLFQIYTDYSDAKQFAERAIYQHTGKAQERSGRGATAALYARCAAARV